MAQKKGKGESYYFDHAYTNFINENGEITEFKMNESGEIHINGIQRKDIEELNDKCYRDFKFSVENIQFKSEEEKDLILRAIAIKILQIKTEYKTGDRIRKNDLKGSIISLHTEKKVENVSIDNIDTFLEPHFHLVIPMKKLSDFGRGYFALKKEIIRILYENNVSSSLNTKFERKDEYSYKILKDRLTAFSWIIEKHNSVALEKYFKDKNKHKLSISLDNVEEMLQKYIDIGGSVSFGKKIMRNLSEKLNFEIVCNFNLKYIEFENDLETQKYEIVLKKTIKIIKNGEKVPEILKYFPFTESECDKVMEHAVRDIYKNRGYFLNEKNEKVYNTEKLDCIVKEAVEKFKEIDRENIKNELNNYLIKSVAKNEAELNIESNGSIRVNRRGEIVYKGQVFCFSEVTDLTRGTYFFSKHFNEIKEKIMKRYTGCDMGYFYTDMREKDAKKLIKNDIMINVKEEVRERKLSESWKKEIMKKFGQENIFAELIDSVLEQRKIGKEGIIDDERFLRKQLKNEAETIITSECTIEELDKMEEKIRHSITKMKYPDSMSYILKNIENKRLVLSEKENMRTHEIDETVEKYYWYKKQDKVKSKEEI